MDRTLIDSHIHFSYHTRLPELKHYCEQFGVDKICSLSLPWKKRINFNPEVLYAKAQLGAQCYGLASLDYSAIFHSEVLPGGWDALELTEQVEQFCRLA